MGLVSDRILVYDSLVMIMWDRLPSFRFHPGRSPIFLGRKLCPQLCSYPFPSSLPFAIRSSMLRMFVPLLARYDHVGTSSYCGKDSLSKLYDKDPSASCSSLCPFIAEVVYVSH